MFTRLTLLELLGISSYVVYAISTTTFRSTSLSNRASIPACTDMCLLQIFYTSDIKYAYYTETLSHVAATVVVIVQGTKTLSTSTYRNAISFTYPPEVTQWFFSSHYNGWEDPNLHSNELVSQRMVQIQIDSNHQCTITSLSATTTVPCASISRPIVGVYFMGFFETMHALDLSTSSDIITTIIGKDCSFGYSFSTTISGVIKVSSPTLSWVPPYSDAGRVVFAPGLLPPELWLSEFGLQVGVGCVTTADGPAAIGGDRPQVTVSLMTETSTVQLADLGAFQGLGISDEGESNDLPITQSEIVPAQPPVPGFTPNNPEPSQTSPRSHPQPTEGIEVSSVSEVLGAPPDPSPASIPLLDSQILPGTVISVGSNILSLDANGQTLFVNNSPLQLYQNTAGSATANSIVLATSNLFIASDGNGNLVVGTQMLATSVSNSGDSDPVSFVSAGEIIAVDGSMSVSETMSTSTSGDLNAGDYVWGGIGGDQRNSSDVNGNVIATAGIGKACHGSGPSMAHLAMVYIAVVIILE